MTEKLTTESRIRYLNQIEHASQFCDMEVEHFVRTFHQHSFSTAESEFDALVDGPYLTHEDLQAAELAEFHFSHLCEFIDGSNSPTPETVDRSPSLNRGAKIELAFSRIASIFSDSIRADKSGRRPYPSGGALYSVEALVVCSDMISGVPPYSVLHYLPISNKFEILKGQFNRDSYHQISSIRGASFYIAYFINIRKAIFKYRSRGYRLALLEAGSMYQLTTAAAQKNNILTRILSGFSDYKFTRMCGIDSRLMLPIIIQAFGVGE